ncbi:MAG: hypothetical protein H6742_09625 [Alphaproteobacteria bacterium]|nr:hypothetical protein [Alphaproteobacteria bacterium]
MLALPPAFLTLPAADDRTFPSIRRKVRLLALRRVLTHPLAGLPPALARSMGVLREALVEAARRDKAATLALVGQPDVICPLLCLEAGVHDPAEALGLAGPTLLAGIAADPRLAPGLAATAVWTHPVTLVVQPPRAWHFVPPARALAALPGGAEVELPDGRRVQLADLAAEHPGHPLRHGPELSTLDTNPLAMLEAHPDKAGNAVDLGGRAPDEWVAVLDDALDLVQQTLPEWYRELPASLHRLVPVGFEPERHLSASYREAPGLCYLTLHPDLRTMAEAVVHETQHSRLNALTWLDPVLHNGWTEWTDSPVRPDLRPLMGVLLAVHAFVPVAAMHARMADQGHPLAALPEFAHRRAQVLAGNARGLRILEDKAAPSAAGARLLRDLRLLHDATERAAPANLYDGRADPQEALPPG